MWNKKVGEPHECYWNNLYWAQVTGTSLNVAFLQYQEKRLNYFWIVELKNNEQWKKLITWVDIPAVDFDRAVKFYSNLLKLDLEIFDCAEEKMACFLPGKELFL